MTFILGILFVIAVIYFIQKSEIKKTENKRTEKERILIEKKELYMSDSYSAEMLKDEYKKLIRTDINLPIGDTLCTNKQICQIIIDVLDEKYNFHDFNILKDYEETRKMWGDQARIMRELGIEKPKTINVWDKPKDRSVVKDAVVGGIIAGPAGAVVGAINAADKNAKNRAEK